MSAAFSRLWWRCTWRSERCSFISWRCTCRLQQHFAPAGRSALPPGVAHWSCLCGGVVRRRHCRSGRVPWATPCCRTCASLQGIRHHLRIQLLMFTCPNVCCVRWRRAAVPDFSAHLVQLSLGRWRKSGPQMKISRSLRSWMRLAHRWLQAIPRCRPPSRRWPPRWSRQR